MNRGLTIGQAAAIAGVTVKTVRHYHRLKLVPEPHRDGSGYRRYGSSELLSLVKVRTLAEAGVPLREIGAMVGADPQRFATHLASVRQRLTSRIEDLVARLKMLDRLAPGNQTLLPDRANALLCRGAELGFPAEFLAFAQEGLTLMQALVPDFDAYLDQIDRAFEDVRYISLLQRSWEATSWNPYDPRVEELATSIAEHQLANPELVALSSTFRGDGDVTVRYGVINEFQAVVATPTAARLSALVETKLRAARLADRRSDRAVKTKT